MLFCHIPHSSKLEVVTMAFLFSPLAAVLRPAMVPIVGGSVALFYGSYDITRMVLGPLVGTKEPVSIHHEVATFGLGLGVSAAGVWARKKINPPPMIPKIDPHILLNANVIKSWILRSTHTIRFFPYFWYGTSISLSGFITGFIVSLSR